MTKWVTDSGFLRNIHFFIAHIYQTFFTGEICWIYDLILFPGKSEHPGEEYYVNRPAYHGTYRLYRGKDQPTGHDRHGTESNFPVFATDRPDINAGGSAFWLSGTQPGHESVFGLDVQAGDIQVWYSSAYQLVRAGEASYTRHNTFMRGGRVER
jgi:hypothetical protein